MDIPGTLKTDIRSGRAVPFLGAGATAGAQRPDKTPPPIANQLLDLLSERFLDNKNSTDSLVWLGYGRAKAKRPKLTICSLRSIISSLKALTPKI